EIEAVRQELGSLRQQLYDRYRERRDRLAGLQEAVRRAARRVQERKRRLEADVTQFIADSADERERLAVLKTREEQLARERQDLDERQRVLESTQQQVERELSKRIEDCQEQERRLADERRALSKNEAQYQADLVRLHRLQALLEDKQKNLQSHAKE